MLTREKIHQHEKVHGRDNNLRRYYNNTIIAGARKKSRHKKVMQVNTMKEEGRIAITFGEVSTTHIGGQEQGEKHQTGFSTHQLKDLQQLFNVAAESYNLNHPNLKPIVTEYFDLKTDGVPAVPEHDAGLLILRNGANLFIDDNVPMSGADRLMYEQYRFVVWDRTSYNAKQDCYTNKRSRFNTVFTSGPRETQNVFGWFFPKEKMNKADRIKKKQTIREPSTSFGSHTIRGNVKKDAKVVVGKTNDAGFASKAQFILDRSAPGYVEATRNPFSELDLLRRVRDKISEFTNKVDPEQKGNMLNAEGNWYRTKDTKSQIGWHGDSERRIVVCLCLGRTSPLYYAWRAPKQSENLFMKTIHVHHGDIYFMSSKATGSDWVLPTADYPLGRSGWRLVHAAGNVQMQQKKRKRK